MGVIQLVTGEVEQFVADDMARLMYDAGFEDVCETRFLLPLFGGNDGTEDDDTARCNSTRRREITRWFKQFWETGMEGWILATSTRYMGVCSKPRSLCTYV
jgi:hypothetical protein